MSHFTVMVATPNGTEAEIATALAPFHEFECTGHIDQYVENIDQLQEAREEYDESTERRLKSPTGELFTPYDDQFYRDPTPEEIKKAGPIGLMGSGFGGGLSYTSRDWGDGKGYRAKVQFIPEGWEEVKLNTEDLKSFAAFVEDYYGRKRLAVGEEPDLEGEHKYGWCRVNEAGEVIELIRRTNPNKQWDWWVVGGRWKNFLLLKNGKKADSARKSDIDFERMLIQAQESAAERYDNIRAIVGDVTGFISWEKMREEIHKGDIDAARAAYHAQRQVKALQNAKEHFTNLEDFLVDRADYVVGQGDEAVRTFAFLKDGEWAERGSMGWWGSVSDEKNNWGESFKKLLASVPENHFLTVVDCHI